MSMFFFKKKQYMYGRRSNPIWLPVLKFSMTVHVLNFSTALHVLNPMRKLTSDTTGQLTTQ
eukprot:SAG31_NODE_3126_length_4646_cov_6.852210_6_plen_61_part_00